LDRLIPAEQVNFAPFYAFKGMENTWVIVVYFDDERSFVKESPAAIYMAMSRAKAYLCLIIPETVRKTMEQGFGNIR
jgi:hypothetical protein